jgi:Toprim domain/CHC2 zinc finger
MTDNIQFVAERLGAKFKRSGHERVGPCPKCGGADRFSVNVQKNLWNCRGCGLGGDAIDLVRNVLDCSYRDALEFIGDDRAYEPRIPTPKPEPPIVDNSFALSLWAGGVEPRGTLVETYLNSRKLVLEADIAGSVLRWHPGIGAMLALFRSIEGDTPQAISRTFLDAAGRKIGRKFLGPVGRAAIKLDPDEEITNGLHIGEGVETAMAARQLGYKPAWALGSAGAISNFPVLSGVETMTFLREHDDANERAVHECASRWLATKHKLRNVWPSTGKDMNDSLMAKGAA